VRNRKSEHVKTVFGRKREREKSEKKSL